MKLLPDQGLPRTAAELLNRAGIDTTHVSVIRIRIERLKAMAAAELLKTVLARCVRELEHGAAVTVREGRIRVRQLPLISSTKA